MQYSSSAELLRTVFIVSNFLNCLSHHVIELLRGNNTSWSGKELSFLPTSSSPTIPSTSQKHPGKNRYLMMSPPILTNLQRRCFGTALRNTPSSSPSPLFAIEAPPTLFFLFVPLCGFAPDTVRLCAKNLQHRSAVPLNEVWKLRKIIGERTHVSLF